MKIKDYDDLCELQDALGDFGDNLAARVHAVWMAMHAADVAVPRDVYKKFVDLAKFALPHSFNYIDANARIRVSDDMHMFPDPEH